MKRKNRVVNESKNYKYPNPSFILPSECDTGQVETRKRNNPTHYYIIII